MLLEDDVLASGVGEALMARGERVALSETTAGGLICARMLSVPGASRWFERGIVPYTGVAKFTQLGIDPEIAKTHGAVSEEWVRATAETLRAASGAAWTIAESGIAGPQGSRRSPKPVGTVVIAVAGPRGTRVEEHAFPGSRVQVMEQISTKVLTMLGEEIAKAAAAG